MVYRYKNGCVKMNMCTKVCEKSATRWSYFKHLNWSLTIHYFRTLNGNSFLLTCNINFFSTFLLNRLSHTFSCFEIHNLLRLINISLAEYLGLLVRLFKENHSQCLLFTILMASRTGIWENRHTGNMSVYKMTVDLSPSIMWVLTIRFIWFPINIWNPNITETLSSPSLTSY